MTLGISIPFQTGTLWPSALASIGPFPRLYTTCAALRADASAPATWLIVIIPGRGVFVWTTVAGTDSADELTDYVAFPAAGGGFALNRDVYRDYATPSTTPPYLAGRVWYDNSALNLMTDFAGVTIQIGEESQIQITNKHSTDSPNGTVVYASGAQGQRLAVKPFANSLTDDALACRVIGLLTHDVAKNANGRATTFGLVRDLDTSGFTAGNEVYSDGAGGVLTETVPPGDQSGARLGFVMNSHPTAGAVFVDARPIPRLASTTANLSASPRTGQVFYDQTIGCLVVWSGSAWQLAIRPGYADLTGDVFSAGSAGGLANAACADSPFLLPHFSSVVAKSVSLIWQMPHDWVAAQPVEPHIHVIGWGTSSGDVRFTWRHAWTRNLTSPWKAWAAWTAGASTTTIPAATAPNYYPRMISLGSITAPAAEQYPSAFLHVQLTREATDSLDTYKSAGPLNLALQGVDCHCLRNGLGTAGLYT